MEVKRTRNSSIELLKLFAIFIIVCAHSVPVPHGIVISEAYIDPTLATYNTQNFFLILFRYGGEFGNAIFVICSSWFLLESCQIKVEKIYKIVADCFAISVLWVLFFLGGGYNISVGKVLKHFFPLWMDLNWFVTCYLLLYAVHPILNIIIRMCDKRKLLIINLVLVILYCGFGFLRPGSFFYSRFVGFVVVYFAVAYIKFFLKIESTKVRLNSGILLFGIFGNFILVFFTNIVGLHNEYFSHQTIRWNTFINPFMLFGALALFNLARKHIYVNSSINYFSRLSLLIYLIHGNDLVAEYFRSAFFEWVYTHCTYQRVICWVILYAIAIFIFSTVLSILYKKFIQKWIYKIYDIIFQKLQKKIENILEFLMQKSR